MKKQKWHLQIRQKGWLKDTACGIKNKDVIAVKAEDKNLIDCPACKLNQKRGGL